MRRDSSIVYKKLDNKLYRKYVDKVVPELKQIFNEDNFHALPQIEKIVVNMGLKHAKDNKAVLEEALNHMAIMTGQKPIVIKAKKSISNFALRKGNPIGCKVTLRGRMMYIFLEKFLKVIVPRIRDFSGLNRSFDKFGNVTIGLIDETIFPEIDADTIKSLKGMNITVVTDKKQKERSIKLFELLGFPFVEK